MYHWTRKLYHACSAMDTETRIAVKDFSNLFDFLLTWSRLTISTTMRDFSSLKKIRAHLRISERCRYDFCKLWRALRWVTVMDCVSCYYNNIWAFSWTGNFTAKNLQQSPLSSSKVHKETTKSWYLSLARSPTYLVSLFKLDKSHQSQEIYELQLIFDKYALKTFFL